MLLPGCASLHPSTPAAPGPTADVSWPERLTQLRRLRHYDMEGRVAASNGQDGFSAGLRWQQNDDQTVIDLTAPLGFGAAHIERTDSILRVTTNKGVTLESDAANEALHSTLGFDAPLGSLQYWVLGASDPHSSAQESLDDMQRLGHLAQDGWEVDYGSYMLVHGQWLPQTLTIAHGLLRLKIIVHDWRVYRILGD